MLILSDDVVADTMNVATRKSTTVSIGVGFDQKEHYADGVRRTAGGRGSAQA